ncbi:unnamed protein product [marine sediment metagenome]|uniref:DUF6250 domain-containing protein n=1 Tax=marine sediment metagenome TaxID=412755 RepID=X1U2E3_9ZZZZ
MKKRVFIAVIYIGFCVSASTVLAQKKKELVHHDKFINLNNWVVEQMDGGKTSIIDERFDIDDVNGCTAWFKEKLEAPCVITYKAKVIGKGGPNDRISDLNCFWLAKDMENPGDFFRNSEKRGGKYPSVHKYYDIAVTDNGNGIATNASYEHKKGKDPDKKAGIYFLRTSLNEKDERTLWTIYNVIREIEYTFRVLKTDLDLRPIYQPFMLIFPIPVLISLSNVPFLLFTWITAR